MAPDWMYHLVNQFVNVSFSDQMHLVWHTHGIRILYNKPISYIIAKTRKTIIF